MRKSSLLYREYLNRVIDDIENFEISRLTSFKLNDMLDVSIDIEDLSFIGDVFKKIDYNYEFIKDNSPISTKLEIKSKLSEGGMLEFFLPEELIEIENKVLENIGEFDSNSPVGFDNMSMGDLEEESGINKINNYMDELGKLYQTVIIDKHEAVQNFIENENNPNIEEIKEDNTKDKVEVKGNTPEDKEEDICFEGLDVEGIEYDGFSDTDESLDYFSSKSIEEIEDIESIRDEEEEKLEFEDIEGDIFEDNVDDLWGEGGNTNFSFIENIEEEVTGQGDIQEGDDISNSKGVTVLGVKIEKGKKIVEDKNVTEIDDILAKAVLLTTGGIIKIPRKATEKLQGIDLKSLLNNFVVDEEEKIEEE